MKISDDCFEMLVRFMRSNYGINLERKRVLVEGRLSAPAGEAGFETLDGYVSNVLTSGDGREITKLVNKLTTNHTFFMREPDHFEFMREVFLPYVENSVLDHDLRIWCAACSNGAEPYSMAMVIDEYFGARGAQWDTTILATDIDTDILRMAAAAEYTPDLLNTLPLSMLNKYFTPLENGSYRVIDRIRREVVFKKFNLMDEIVYKKPFDLICCRNVMIYFDQDTKTELVERFYDCTKPGGYLFIGHAENISRNSDYIYIKPAVFRKPW